MIRFCNYLLISPLLFFLFSCGESKQKLFTLKSPDATSVYFSNDLQFKQDFNIYRYRNFYNGGGVAIGDVNNDGLVDLFFTANQKKNRLYLNQGNFKFVDVTQKAGVAGTHAWSTGVSMADINGDGLLDIYVCNSGIVNNDNRKNELYINNGDTTFTEKAASYGIADSAFSIHGNFFDYDRDGDLDLYLVNNSYRAIGSFNQEKNTRNIRDSLGGDKLYRNDGNHFTDVSAKAGIYGSEIGFGLGVSVGDLNRDGWPDMYISNDFFERDYLYINNRDGSFREVLEQKINSISASAMGGDIADLNGDGYPEIFVTDMLPKEEKRLKRVTSFDSWERYREYVNNGYYHQFTRNTLQLNNGNGTFSEVGRYAGVEATDWSWGANLVDLNLDGRRDIFISNGIPRDITDLDYLQKISQQEMIQKIVRDSTVNFRKLIEMIPSNPISNYAFYNRGNLQFSDSTSRWGLERPQFSTGSAYGDLDNDGDPDLVINNLNAKASIYENNATEISPRHNWLRLTLKGNTTNTYAIGTQVTAWSDGRKWYISQFPVRGFQSTVDHRLLLGFGRVKTLDSLIVDWFNGGTTTLKKVETNQEIVLHEAKARSADHQLKPAVDKMAFSFEDITAEININWQHTENKFNDFKRDNLTYHMRSTEGPPICTADINKDGLDDFYVGGAKGQSGELFLQQKGSFISQNVSYFEQDKQSEDIDCVWFDADGNGRPDLYVSSGGIEFPPSSSALADRLYLQTDNLTFVRAKLGIFDWRYKTAGSVSVADYDGDGDKDLFLGARLQPFGLGLPVNGYLLRNDGKAHFTNVTEKIAPELKKIGMITDSKWGDIDQDNDLDLIISGEWMPLTIFENNNGKFINKTQHYGLSQTSGWWNTILLEDLDGDKDLDMVAGNHGLNSRFSASVHQPMELWINDFDENGTIDPIMSIYKNNKRYPVPLRHDLFDQLPFLKRRYPSYKSFAGQTMSEIIPITELDGSFHRSIVELSSIVGWNEDGKFIIEELPMKGQLTPIYGLLSSDLNNDGSKEIITGGNLYNADPEVGRYDAGFGTVFTIRHDTLVTLPANRNGFNIDGQIRDIKSLKMKAQEKIIIVSQNNGELKFFKVLN